MEQFRASKEDWELVESESDGISESATIRELRDRVAALEAGAAVPTATPDTPQTLHSVALAHVDALGRSFGLLPEILDTLRRAIREPIATGEGPVATDEEIAAAANRCLTPGGARRAIYNLGRQHATIGSHIRQGDSGSQYCDLARQTAEPAPLPPLEVGQRWRTKNGVVVEIMDFTDGAWWASVPWGITNYDNDHKSDRVYKSEPSELDLIQLVEPAPVKSPQQPTYELVLAVMQAGRFQSSEDARDVIREVASWLREQGDDGSANRLEIEVQY